MATPHCGRLIARRRARRVSAFLTLFLAAGLPLAELQASQAANAARPRVFAAAAPSGFDELLRPQTNVVDVFFGGRRVGVALATFAPGTFRFADARAAVALVRSVRDSDKVIAALAPTLPTHAELVCAEQQPENCGHLTPDVAGIIFDETRFRAEIFVNPAYLQAAKTNAAEYLPAPVSGLSLADTIGGAVSGSDTGTIGYSIQNRAAVGYHEGRLAAEFSQSSDLGFQTDTLAASMDRPGMRYVGGLFWTHDRDFNGQRRIYGLSIGTQNDTRADRDQSTGSTLTLFLPRRSQVDIVKDGRLLASKIYDAGNQALDTSALPDGSYAVVLKIHEIGGPTREEQQFFVKSRSIPIEGQPDFFLDGGVLARDAPRPLPGTLPSFFVETGGALRLTSGWAIDAVATGTGLGASLELGNTFFSDWLRFHAALFGATQARYGAMLNAEVHILPSLVFFMNARRTWGPTGSPLPQQSQNFSFDDVDLTTANQLSGDSTQASANLSWVIGNAQVGATATYLKSPFEPRTYAFGPSIDWPFWNSDDMTMTLTANCAQSNDGPHGFVGLRLQFNAADYSVIANAGGESARDDSGNQRSGAIGNLAVTTDVPDVASSELTASAGIAHALSGDTVALEGQLRGPYGLYMAETEHDLGAGTRYSANFVSGAALAGGDAALGGADASESGILVRLEGKAVGTEVEVLIDGAPEGRLSVGHSLPVFLPPYRVYSVRLRPLNAPSVEFDTGERPVSLFPGNVETLVWDIESVIDIFGRAVREDGRPVANARIEGARNPGMTDENGYFQVEIAQNAALTFRNAKESDCKVVLGDLTPKHNYAGVGELTCRSAISSPSEKGNAS